MMNFNSGDVMGHTLESMAQFPICFIPLILIAIIYLYKTKKNIQPSVKHLRILFIVLALSTLCSLQFPLYFIPLLFIGIGLGIAIRHLYKTTKKGKTSRWSLSVCFIALILFIIYAILGGFCVSAGYLPTLEETYMQLFLRTIFIYSYFFSLFYLLLIAQRRLLRMSLYLLCFLPYLHTLYFFVWGSGGSNGYMDILVWVNIPPVGIWVNGDITNLSKLLFLMVLIATAIMEAIRFHRQKKSMKQQDNLLQDHQEGDETTKTDKS